MSLTMLGIADFSQGDKRQESFQAFGWRESVYQ